VIASHHNSCSNRKNCEFLSMLIPVGFIRVETRSKLTFPVQNAGPESKQNVSRPGIRFLGQECRSETNTESF
jgi:hypothetical protein